MRPWAHTSCSEKITDLFRAQQSGTRLATHSNRSSMPPLLSLPFGRLPADLRRRLDLAEAAARDEIAETHAEQALDLVAVLAPRMPFDEATERYLELMELDGDEAELVQRRALLRLNDPAYRDALTEERPRGGGFHWRDVTPVGAVRFLRRRMQRSAEEELWMDLSEARAEEALIDTHLSHARHFAELLEEHTPPPQSVALYLDRMEVQAGRARAVYQRALAQVADEYLPRLDHRAHSAPPGRGSRRGRKR